MAEVWHWVKFKLIQFDVDQKASFDQVMQAIDRKIPVSKSALYSQYALPEPLDDDADFVHSVEKLVLSSYLLGMIHADEERPGKEINAADDEIPPIKFEEAVEFLKRKVPMSKAEWLELEPKLRFRAFTVAQLGSVELVDKAKQILLKSFEKGGGTYSDTWEELKKKVNVNALGIKPSYWENVFSTNTQSAYIAGKLQQYENTNVAAYQLMVIEDGRTSKICRHLLTSNGYGMIISVEHPFWKKYGFPPYHFQCRTSIRAIWPSQVGKLGNMVENPTMKSLSKFKGQEGFGGNPLERGTWWEMTDSMKKLAEKFGVMEKIEAEKIALGIKPRDVINNKCETDTLFKSIEDVEEKFKQEDWFHHGTINGKPWRSDSELTLYGIDVKSASEFYDAYRTVFEKLPIFKNKFSAPGAHILGKSTYANSLWTYAGNADVTLNVHWFSSWEKISKRYAEDVADKFHPAGTSAKAVFYHEIGHDIDCYCTEVLKLSHGKKTFSSYLKQKAMRNLKIKTGYDTITEELSEYSLKNYHQ